MPNIEAITVMAVVEAQDKATGILSGIFSTLEKLGASMQESSAAAAKASEYFAGSQYAAMTAADRLAAMETLVADREAEVALATEKVSEAQRVSALAYEEAASSASTMAAANEEVRVAQLLNSAAVKEASLVSKELADADGFLADVLKSKLLVAQEEVKLSTERLMTAQKLAADAIEANGIKVRTSADANRDLKIAQAEGAAASTSLKGAQEGLGIAQAEVSTKTKAAGEALAAAKGTMLGIGGATLIAAAASTKLAGDFQQQTQVLVAGAGVQQNELEGVRRKIMEVSKDTGTSTKELSESYFQINSRIGDVATSNQVLADASELAKVHMADLKTVSIALAGSMNAYKGSNLTAAQASNILGVAVEQGGMSFQDLAGSLSTVLPKAQEAGISFAQVTAAVATMTRSGQTAQMATQDLAHTIGKLQSPTAEMINTWNQMGLTQKQVSEALHGPGGLEAAMNMIAETAKSKVGPNGEIVIKTFKESQDAANSLKTALQDMDPAAKKLATELQNGSISSKDYTKSAKDLSEAQAVQALQFKSLYDKANGFNDAIKSGKPGFSDFSALLKSSYGDATSMQTALLLGGKAAEKWTEITKDAASAAGDNSGKIRGWDAIQGTLNQKMAQAHAALQVTAITIGTALLPAVTSIVAHLTPWIEKVGEIAQHHQTLLKAVVAAGLALGAMVAGMTAVSMILKILSPLLAVFNAILDANPIMLVVLAIAALVFGLIELYKHSAAARQIMNEIGEYLKTGLKVAIEVGGVAIDWLKGVIKDMIAWFVEHKQEFIDAWDKTMQAVKKVAKWFDDNVIKYIKGLVQDFSQWWHDHLDEIKTTWNVMWTIIKTNFEVTWTMIKGILQTAFGFWKVTWGLIKDAAIMVWDSIKNEVTMAMHLIQNIIAVIMDLISGHWGKAWQDLKKLASQAWNDLWNWLGGLASDAWHMLEDAGKNLIKGLINGIKSMASSVKNSVKDIVSSARNLLPFSPAKEGPLSGNGGFDYAGKTMGKMLADGMLHSIPQVRSAAHDMASSASVKAMAALGLDAGNGAFNDFGAGAMQGVLGAGMGLSAPVGMIGRGGGDIHIHLDQGSLQGTVITDTRAMDDFTQKLGYHIATKVLPQAGVRIHG